MVTGILIIAFSVALLIYWFRYSCMLILRSQSEAVALEPSIAAEGRFSFMEIKELLKSERLLDPLQASLNRDYQVLTYLIEHAAGLELATLEDRLLMLDYRLMHNIYRLTRRFAPGQARRAVAEMAAVLGILAHHLGEQAGVQFGA
jgi:hypothetical protein